MLYNVVLDNSFYYMWKMQQNIPLAVVILLLQVYNVEQL